MQASESEEDGEELLRQSRQLLSDEAYQELHYAALSDLSNGGRGIGNQVESLLINPLARWLFQNEILSKACVEIQHFITDTRPAEVCCRILPEPDPKEV